MDIQVGWFLGMVSSVHQTNIEKILQRAMVTYEELLILVVEIEGILNCRPITYVYNDEFSEPLTLRHLIYGYRVLSTKSINDQNLLENEQFSTSHLSKHIKYLTNLLESYWNQWTKKYLSELREQHKTRKNDQIR